MSRRPSDDIDHASAWWCAGVGGVVAICGCALVDDGHRVQGAVLLLGGAALLAVGLWVVAITRAP